MSVVTRGTAEQLDGRTQGNNAISKHLAVSGMDQHILPQEEDVHGNHEKDRHAVLASKPEKTHGATGQTSTNGLADFFSPEVFRIVLHNPTTAHRLLKFSQARMCGENMEFLEKVCLMTEYMADWRSDNTAAV